MITITEVDPCTITAEGVSCSYPAEWNAVLKLMDRLRKSRDPAQKPLAKLTQALTQGPTQNVNALSSLIELGNLEARRAEQGLAGTDEWCEATEQWAVGMAKALGQAWLKRDGEFFNRHAELWRAWCDEVREGIPAMMSHKERICSIALRLRSSLGRDPTKRKVRAAASAQGLSINEKDWSKYWKECGLDFLPHAKGGRPSQKPPETRESGIRRKRERKL